VSTELIELQKLISQVVAQRDELLAKYEQLVSKFDAAADRVFALIAQRDELLAALKDMVSLLVDGPKGGGLVSDRTARAKAAIARGEGRSEPKPRWEGPRVAKNQAELHGDDDGGDAA
jgi:hypothetical protein